jgi:hypothetical protein
MVYKKVVFVLLIAFAASPLFAVNLFSAANSSFESGKGDWSISTFNSSFSADIATDSVNAIFGKKYLKVTVKKISADSTDSNWVVQLWEPAWTAKQNVNYTYFCWAKTDSVMNRPLTIAATGDSASEYTYKTSSYFSLTKDWQLCSLSYIWTPPVGTTKKHFRLFIAGAKGIYCFDSMAIDTGSRAVQTKDPLTISYRKPSSDFTYQLLPNCLRIAMNGSAVNADRFFIYSLEGRLIASQNIPSATKAFEIPKPVPGAWVVGVNSNKRVIRIP